MNTEMTIHNAEINPFFAAICNICTGTEDIRRDLMDFTAEEINLIAIYRAGTRMETQQQIAAALPYMEIDMRTISESASEKLSKLTEHEFSAIPFTPADETDGE